MKVSAKLSKENAEKLGVPQVTVEAEANIPATLAEKVKAFGEEIVNGAVEDSLVISVQALMRRMMVPRKDKDGKITKAASTPAEIQAAVAAWKPDVRTTVRQSAFEKASAAIGSLSPEEKKALLASLTGNAQAAPTAATAQAARK